MAAIPTFRIDQERVAGPNDDRLSQIDPPRSAHDSRTQQLAGFQSPWIGRMHADAATGGNTLQVKPGNEAIVREAEREARVFMEPLQANSPSRQTLLARFREASLPTFGGYYIRARRFLQRAKHA